MTVRALLDSGAEESFISDSVAHALNLDGNTVNVVVSGVGGGPAAVSRNRVTITLKSDDDKEFDFRFSALVLKKLTAALPSELVVLPPWPELSGLKLADPGWSLPRRIDCILSSEVYAAALRPGVMRGPRSSLVALKSVFGWVLMGSTRSSTSPEQDTAAFHVTVDQSLSQAVSRFWEIEEVPRQPTLPPEEQECYEHFRSTQRRDEHGRFIVRLPFARPPVLQDTRQIAERCLFRLERRLQRDPTLAKAYADFMSEYLELGHLEIVPEVEVKSKSAYYLPHHPVFKSDGKKIRVVFNASQQDAAGNSLNSFLFTGTKLQEDVLIVVICWEFLRVAFTCDIVKMFRQYRLHPADMDWLRILWRFVLGGPVQTARLTTVTYGTGCASFLANACLLQLADEEKTRFPRGARLLRKGRYMDDFFSGADEVEEAVQTRDELVDILATAGMQVGKWASNRAELLPDTGGGDSVSVPLDTDTVSTLGLRWMPVEDVFCFSTQEVPDDGTVTKRVILSAVARLFDPIGWLAPFIIRPKVLLQDLWMRGVDWDAPIPSDLLKTWIKFRGEIPQLEEIKIHRWFGTRSATDWQLHGFCDASERAYAAGLYIVTRAADGTSSRLMTAKSKVAPLKIVSLPRLELCGAGLLASLIHYVLPSLPTRPSKIYCWSDSKVALAWISSHPSRWKAFVANRVSDIREKIPDAVWNHVRSADNPADLATRGLSPEQLLKADIWWRGPDWLRQPESAWPTGQSNIPDTEVEAKKVQAFRLEIREQSKELSLWATRFSSFGKLIRILSYAFRWKLNARLQKNERKGGWLTAYEMELGRMAIYKSVQAQVYHEEIISWQKEGAVSRSSSICKLSPFLDCHGVLRVGGRLQNAYLSEDEKHPVILPAKHHVTELIVMEAHRQTLHGGPSLVQSHLLRRIWIVRGRNFIRTVVRKCVRCTRFRAAPIEQQMGPLPEVRTRPARCFSCTGVDYAGPFYIKSSPGRGQKCFKGYVAVFVCMVVRAVHLEVVSDYTSNAFLAAFRRFAARRGTPATMISDNGTNFKGAEAELTRMFAEASAISQEVAAELAHDGIEWRYSPPRAPNFGGLWESSVKAFKYHLKRVVGDERLTFEEITTLTASIEACLNSRPLSAQSQAEEDVAALTPGHFLIGAALTAPPEPFDEINENNTVCSRWKRVCLMRNNFWKRWQRECLAHMQQRSKWLKPSRDFKVGDVVLFKDALMPPAKWPLARITKLYFGTDGLSRVAIIRTATAEYKRAINKLILLPVQEGNKESVLFMDRSTAGGTDDAMDQAA